MRQVNVHGPGDVRLDSVAAPVVGPADALVRVSACGICGTDLTFIWRGRARAGATAPMPLGHEAVGIVTEIGSDVADLVPGQRVMVNPMGVDSVIGNGGPEGALADVLLVRDALLGRSLFPVPDDVPDPVAISEAVSLARELSTDESPGFVNGLLARIVELKPTLAR